MISNKLDQGLINEIKRSIDFPVTFNYMEDITIVRLFRNIEALHWKISDKYPETLIKFWNIVEIVLSDCCMDERECLFKIYKRNKAKTRVSGTIIFNDNLDKVVVVKARSRNPQQWIWSFPKGKMEECDHNKPIKCAIRETYEEIGVNISKYIRSKHYVNLNGHRFYTVLKSDISENTDLKPQVNNEIFEISWIPLSKLKNLDNGDVFIKKFGEIAGKREWVTKIRKKSKSM